MQKKQPHQQPQRTPCTTTMLKTPEEWKAHWKAQGQDWRTEPEISEQRQAELAKRRAIEPSIERSVYPFGKVKLNRADIEWLLATHENGNGPVIWDDEKQRDREGLDVRGADLSNSKDHPVDLSGLPLSCLCGGLSWSEWLHANEEQRVLASVILRGTSLKKAHVERATLRGAQLEKVNFTEAYLEEANLSLAKLEGANFLKARLKKADLSRSHVEMSNFNEAQLERTSFFATHLARLYPFL